MIVIFDTASPQSSDSYASVSTSPSTGPLISDAGLLGVTIFEFTDEPAPRAKRNQMALHIAHDRTATVELPDRRAAAEERRAFPIRVDTLTLAQAEALARQLAPLQLSAGGGDEPLLSALDFTDLLGIEDAAEIYAPNLWQRGSASPHDRLRVPIGVGEDGQPVVLDLKEAALGGMGPHGLCVGATGSGKSELLRSLVSALALTHSSEQVNFILADFKGGATFAGLAALPHVAAVITNLADDLTLVDRMRDALTGELNRRQELLKRAGNAKNVHDYEKARAGSADLVPLPSLAGRRRRVLRTAHRAAGVHRDVPADRPDRPVARRASAAGLATVGGGTAAWAGHLLVLPAGVEDVLGRRVAGRARRLRRPQPAERARIGIPEVRHRIDDPVQGRVCVRALREGQGASRPGGAQRAPPAAGLVHGAAPGAGRGAACRDDRAAGA